MSLTCFEIRNKITINNEEIKRLLFTDTFILNKKVQELLEENFDLSNTHAVHEDDGTGICKVCNIKI